MNTPKEIETIEASRAFWADIAKKNGWYQEPFYVQVWLNADGTAQDSVSHKGMTQDHILRAVRTYNVVIEVSVEAESLEAAEKFASENLSVVDHNAEIYDVHECRVFEAE